MDKIGIAIIDLGTSIGWIEGNDHHKFAGWMNVVNAMKNAKELLKEQEDEIKQLRLALDIMNGKGIVVNS